MADETSDLSNHEELVICITWIGDNVEAREHVIGLLKLERANSTTTTALNKDCLKRMNMYVNKVRCQCFNGCSTVSRANTGVTT